MEFFCSAAKFQELKSRLSSQATLTYMAVQSEGEVQSNVKQIEANAVTWGVFPGKEVVQPTVVDPASFSIWKASPFSQYKNLAAWCLRVLAVLLRQHVLSLDQPVNQT